MYICKASNDAAVHAYSFLMLAQGSMDDTHIKENLGRIRDVVEFLQRLLEFIVVIAAQGRDPRFYFLGLELASNRSFHKGPCRMLSPTHLFQ